MFYILDSDGYIEQTMDYSVDGAFEFDFPDDFDFYKQHEYKIDGGELIHSPRDVTSDFKEELEEELRAKQAIIAAQMLVQTADLTDEQALTVSTLYPEWSDGSVEYKERTSIVQYGGHLYRCAKNHTSSEQNNTSVTSLWTKIDKAGDGVDIWQQPTGAHDAYNKGDRVHYPDADGPIYVSKIDGNTWSPDSYPDGWELEGGAD